MWSNTPTAPGRRYGDNLLASWHLAQPLAPAPRVLPQPAAAATATRCRSMNFPASASPIISCAACRLRVSALRTLGAYANVFAIESFMDEMAAAAGADPVAFRLGASRRTSAASAVIEAVGQGGRLETRPKGDGVRGRGVGFARYKNAAAYVAVVAESQSTAPAARCASSASTPRPMPGRSINPDGLKNQIEGGIIQSASWTLHEQVKFDARRHCLARLAWLSDPHHAGGPPDAHRPDRPAGPALARRRRSLGRVRRPPRSPMPSRTRRESACATCRSMPPA